MKVTGSQRPPEMATGFFRTQSPAASWVVKVGSCKFPTKIMDAQNFDFAT